MIQYEYIYNTVDVKDMNMLPICKECFVKKYGKFQDIYYKVSNNKGKCMFCEEEKHLIEERFPPIKDYIFFN